MTYSRFSGVIEPGSHLWFFLMLVAKHHHRDQATPVLVIVDQLSPPVMEHVHAMHEAADPKSLPCLRAHFPTTVRTRHADGSPRP